MKWAVIQHCFFRFCLISSEYYHKKVIKVNNAYVYSFSFSPLPLILPAKSQNFIKLNILLDKNVLFTTKWWRRVREKKKIKPLMTSVCFTPDNVSEHLLDVPGKRPSQRHRTVQLSKSSPADLQALFFSPWGKTIVVFLTVFQAVFLPHNSQQSETEHKQQKI